SEARYVVLTNILAMLGVVFTLGFAPVLLISGSVVFPALQVIYALGYLPPLWLNHRRHHSAATCSSSRRCSSRAPASMSTCSSCSTRCCRFWCTRRATAG